MLLYEYPVGRYGMLPDRSTFDFQEPDLRPPKNAGIVRYPPGPVYPMLIIPDGRYGEQSPDVYDWRICHCHTDMAGGIHG